MAGVPEIEPTEGAQAQPSPVQVAPPLGAFKNAALGEGLSDIGKEIFAVGMDSYKMAVEASAQVAETHFQTNAAKILADYKTKFGWSAISSHSEVTAAIAKARQDTLESLPSKMGRQYFNNSTLRIQRYAQESADAHFEQQNKIFQFGSYKNKQAADLADLRTYAANTTKADEIEKKVVDRATEQYGALVGDQEATDAEVRRVRGLVADTVLRSVADRGGDAEVALKKYGPLATTKAVEAAQQALFSQQVDAAHDEIFKDVKRLDTRKREDPSHGMLDAVLVNERLNSRPRDQHTDELTKAVNKTLDADAKENKSYADTLGGQIRAVLNAGGKPDPSLWTSLNNAGPYGAKLFSDLINSNNKRAQNEAHFTKWQQDGLDKDTIQQAGWSLMGSQSPSDRKLFTKEEMLNQLDAKYPGASAKVHRALSDEYDKWQKLDDRSFETQASKLAKVAVQERWGNTQRHSRDLAQLYEYLKNHKTLVEITTDDVVLGQAKNFLASDRSEAPTVVSRERAEAPKAAAKDDIVTIKGHRYNVTQKRWED